MQRGNTNQKKARIPTLISETDFRDKNINRQNEGNYKLSSLQTSNFPRHNSLKEHEILNIQATKIIELQSPQCKKQINLQGEIEKFITIIRYFHTFLPIMHKRNRKSIKYINRNNNIKILHLTFMEHSAQNSRTQSFFKSTQNTYQDRTIYRVIR